MKRGIDLVDSAQHMIYAENMRFEYALPRKPN